jgi:hypothetical protein
MSPKAVESSHDSDYGEDRVNELFLLEQTG